MEQKLQSKINTLFLKQASGYIKQLQQQFNPLIDKFSLYDQIDVPIKANFIQSFVDSIAEFQEFVLQSREQQIIQIQELFEQTKEENDRLVYENNKFESESTRLTIMLQVSDEQMKKYRSEIMSLGQQIKKLNIGIKQQDKSRHLTQVYKADSYKMSEQQIQEINNTLNNAQNQEKMLSGRQGDVQNQININDTDTDQEKVAILSQKLQEQEQILNVKKVHQSTSMRSGITSKKKQSYFNNDNDDDIDDDFDGPERYSQKSKKQVKKLQQIVYELTDKEVSDISKNNNLDVSKQLQLLQDESEFINDTYQNQVNQKQKSKNKLKKMYKQKEIIPSNSESESNSTTFKKKIQINKQIQTMPELKPIEKKNISRFKPNTNQSSTNSLLSVDSIGMVVKQVSNDSVRNSSLQPEQNKQNGLKSGTFTKSQLSNEMNRINTGQISSIDDSQATDNYDPKGKFKVYSLASNQTRAPPKQSNLGSVAQKQFQNMSKNNQITNQRNNQINNQSNMKGNNQTTNLSDNQDDNETQQSAQKRLTSVIADVQDMILLDDQQNPIIYEISIEEDKPVLVKGLTGKISFDVDDYLDENGNLCTKTGEIKLKRLEIEILKQQKLGQTEYFQPESKKIDRQVAEFNQKHANELFENGKRPVYTNSKTEKILQIHTCNCKEYDILLDKYNVLVDKNKFLEKVISQLSKQSGQQFKMNSNVKLDCKSSIASSPQKKQFNGSQQICLQQSGQQKVLLPDMQKLHNRTESPILKSKNQLFHSGNQIEKIINCKAQDSQNLSITNNSQKIESAVHNINQIHHEQLIDREESPCKEQKKNIKTTSNLIQNPYAEQIHRNSFIEGIDDQTEKNTQTLLSLDHYIPTPETALVGFQNSEIYNNQTRNCFSPSKGAPWQGRSASIQVNDRISEFEARSLINAERSAYISVALKLRKEGKIK